MESKTVTSSGLGRSGTMARSAAPANGECPRLSPRRAIGVVGATCPRCHDRYGLLARRALETLLARGPVAG